METTNDRIKKIRLHHSLSQEDFGNRIGIKSRAHISALENGSRNVTDRIVKDICAEYKVNECWLREGVGQMLEESDGTILAQLRDEYDADTLDMQIVEKYLKLAPEKRKVIKEYILSIASSYLQASAAGQADDVPDARAAEKTDIDIEAELASYRRELEAEKEARISSASQDAGA